MTYELDIDKLYSQSQQMIAAEDAAREQRNNVAIYKERLKLQLGKEYTFRIVPYIKEGYENAMSKTFYRYYQYNWRRADGGKWQFVISPRTVGKDCPIAEWQSNYRRTATKDEIDDLRSKLGYKEGHYINVYVLNDPVNPENNGTIKILDCPRPVWKLINDALRGELDDEWSEMKGHEYKVGPRVLDLTDEGVNLVVKSVPQEKRPDMPDYSKSKFTTRDAKLGWDDDKRNEVISGAYDLSKVDRIMATDDIIELFNTTFLPKIENATPVASKKAVVVESKDDEDAVPEFKEPVKAAPVDDDDEVDEDDDEPENMEDFMKKLGLKKGR